jgi:hypothetical protein
MSPSKMLVCTLISGRIWVSKLGESLEIWWFCPLFWHRMLLFRQLWNSRGIPAGGLTMLRNNGGAAVHWKARRRLGLWIFGSLWPGHWETPRWQEGSGNPICHWGLCFNAIIGNCPHLARQTAAMSLVSTNVVKAATGLNMLKSIHKMLKR